MIETTEAVSSPKSLPNHKGSHSRAAQPVFSPWRPVHVTPLPESKKLRQRIRNTLREHIKEKGKVERRRRGPIKTCQKKH